MIKTPTKKKIVRRRKPCYFHLEKMNYIDYKNSDLLEKFVNTHGRILASRITGTCAKHQRLLSIAIKRARIMALLPFSQERIRK